MYNTARRYIRKTALLVPTCKRDCSVNMLYTELSDLANLV